MRPWWGASQRPLFASPLGAAGKITSGAVGPKIDQAASSLLPGGFILLSRSHRANWKRLLSSSYNPTAQISKGAVTHLLCIAQVWLDREPSGVGGWIFSPECFSPVWICYFCAASQA